MKKLIMKKWAIVVLVILATACGCGTGCHKDSEVATNEDEEIMGPLSAAENEKRLKGKSPTGLRSITSKLRNGMSEGRVVAILGRSPDKTYLEREGQKEYRTCKWLVYPCVTPEGRSDLKYGVIFCQFVRGKDGEWVLDYYGPSWQRTAKL